MAFKRIATWKREEQGPAIIIEWNGRSIAVQHSQLATLNTATKLKLAVETIAGESLSVWFHFNRAGNVAMATGAEPEVWPEDDIGLD
jgi:hypothetical protein